MYVFDDIGFRPVEERDLENIRHLRNDDTTFSQLTFAEMISPSAQMEWFQSLATAKDRAFYTVVKICRDEDGVAIFEDEFVGIIRASEIDRINRSICVGADVAPGMRGKGYGTKIYRALLRYLFRDLALHRVWLMVLETNEIGRRLYENIGFQYEGTRRKAIWRNGAWRDYMMMSILEDEYRAGAK